MSENFQEPESAAQPLIEEPVNPPTVEVSKEAEKPVSADNEVKEEKAKDEPTFSLGDYKRLARITSLQIDGETRPLFGRANFEYSPYRDRKDSDLSRTAVDFPTMGLAGISQAADGIRSLDFKNSSEARDWASTVERSNELITVNDAYLQALNREGSNWQQVPRFNGQALVSAKARQPEYKDRELKDSQALMYALSGLGLGTPVQSPMWHSGFWVSFRPALEDAWINFNDRITLDKIRIGRASSGLALSNINAIFLERALEFALDHVLDHNIRLEPGSDRRTLLKKLRAQDISHFLWGFLSANHPDGYPISRACSAAIGTCTEVIRETINLRILQVTDETQLTEAHKAHMARVGSGSVTEAEVDNYQNTMQCLQPVLYDVIKTDALEVKIKLAPPSAEDYILSGRRWFDGIVEMVNGIMAADTTDKQRDRTYQNYAKAASMREYTHWVKEIHLNSNVVKDLLTLENLLTNLSPRFDMRKSFYKKVADYIEASTMSVIAIPNYACPTCKQPQIEEDVNKRFVDCIPLDVAQAFFNLALLRTMELTSR